MYGWARPAGLAAKGSISTTRSPWCGSGPGTATARSIQTPTGKSAPRPSTSAAPRPTSRASCTGSTRPSRSPAEPGPGRAQRDVVFRGWPVAGATGRDRSSVLIALGHGAPARLGFRLGHVGLRWPELGLGRAGLARLGFRLGHVGLRWPELGLGRAGLARLG